LRSVVWLLVVLVFSFIATGYLLIEATTPMTSNRYAVLCGGRPNCYPEIGFAIGAAVAGFVALLVGVALLLAVKRRIRSR
jgi:hypothetical protein